MGAVFLHGMGTSSGARQCGVTHVPGLKCYLCPRTVPRPGLLRVLSVVAALVPRRLVARLLVVLPCRLDGPGITRPVAVAELLARSLDVPPLMLDVLALHG